MHMYFCPHCGTVYESKSCKKVKGRIPMQPRLICPQCDKPVQVSGVVWILLGLLIGLVFSITLCSGVPAVGVIIGVAFGVVGVIRLIRQFRAGSSSRN